MTSVAAAMLLTGCGRQDAPAENGAAANTAAPTAESSVDPLVGSWTSDAPAEFSGEGLRTRVSDSRTEYRPDGSFGYTARLAIFGERLPAEGMGFAVAGQGRWQRQGDQLTERYSEVRVTPKHEDGELRRLADQLGREMQAAPAVTSRVEALADGRMTLVSEGRRAAYTRQP